MFRFVYLFILINTYNVASLPSSIHNTNLIVGGRDAAIGQFPYQVSLQYLTEFGWSHFCAGSIISDTYILTSCKCALMEAGSRRVVAGNLKLNETSDTEQTAEIESFLSNEDYSGFTHRNDIAIGKLETPLIFNSYVQPVPLQNQSDVVAAGTNCSIAGWGTTRFPHNPDFPYFSNSLLYTTLPVVSDDQCREVYYKAVIDSMMCAGYADGGYGACQGDEGSALVDLVTGNQVGIYSFSYHCGHPEYPEVFTSIASFRDWIDIVTAGAV